METDTKYILITHGIRPFAQRVARQLSGERRVVFGTADELPDVLLNSGKYISLPNASSSAFVHEMLKVCLDHPIATVIPLGKLELARLLEAKILFDEYGIQLLLPQRQVMDKLMIIENPPTQLPLIILEKGSVITGDSRQWDAALSGVFTPSDSGDEMALCCIAD